MTLELGDSLPSSDISSDIVNKFANHLDVVTGHDLWHACQRNSAKSCPRHTILSAASEVPSGQCREVVMLAVRKKI